MSTSSAAAATVRNFQAAADKINKAARQLGDLYGPGLRMIGEEIIADVKDSAPGRGVPTEKGILKASGRAEGPIGPKDSPIVELSFGGASAPYALIQHEVTTFHHTIGEARYLVRGMERWTEGGSGAMAVMRKKAAVALDQENKG